MGKFPKILEVHVSSIKFLRIFPESFLTIPKSFKSSPSFLWVAKTTIPNGPRFALGPGPLNAAEPAQRHGLARLAPHPGEVLVVGLAARPFGSLDAGYINWYIFIIKIIRY
jgi:hypothetical protein